MQNQEVNSLLKLNRKTYMSKFVFYCFDKGTVMCKSHMMMVANGQRLVYFLLYDNRGTDEILCSKKDQLTRLGFSQEMYECSVSHSLLSLSGIQTVSADLEIQNEIFPTQHECDMFKKSSSSWFIMRRAEVKRHYTPDPAAFAKALNEVLGLFLEMQFDPKKHDKFFRD